MTGIRSALTVMNRMVSLALRVLMTVGTLAVVLAISACAQWEPASIRLPDVSVVRLSAVAGSDELEVELRVDNPNRFALAFVGMDFDLAVDGQRLARGLAVRDLVVPPLDSTRVSVITSSIDLQQARQLSPLRGESQLNYEIVGRLYLGPKLIHSIPFARAASL